MRSKIGDVCESVSITFRRQIEEIVLINTSDVSDGSVTNHSYSPNENLRGQFKKSFQRHDILYSEIRPKNRRFAYVDFDANNYVASTKLMVIRANEKVLPTFLFQILKSDEVIDQLQGLAETRSGTFPQITFSELAALDVRIPTIEEQRAIADTLSALDARIAQNKKINHHLEQMAQAIFKSWFVDFEPWGGVMPEEWREGTLTDICTYGKERIMVSELTPSTYISTENMQANKAGYVDAANLPTTSQTTAFKEGNVLISNIRPYFKKIVFCDFIGGCSTDVLCFCPNENVPPSFLYSALYGDSFFEYMVSGSKGTKMPRGDKSQIMQYTIAMPDGDVFAKYDAAVNPILASISEHRKEIESLAALRDTLLPRLMSGEIKIDTER